MGAPDEIVEIVGRGSFRSSNGMSLAEMCFAGVGKNGGAGQFNDVMS